MIKKLWQNIFNEKKNYILVFFAFLCLILAIFIILLILNYKEEKTVFLPYSSSDSLAINTKTEKETNLEKQLIAVDIGGAVKNSGIYELAETSRLADLIKTAGGFDLERVDKLWLQKKLNLAERLTDGKKYYIPYLEEVKSTKENSTSEDASVENNNNKLISINQATLKSLTTLPGVGEVRGQAIIDGRPYLKIEDLLTSEVVTETIFEKLKSLISL